MKNKVKEIAEGYFYNLIQNDVVNEEAERRLSICNACPSKSALVGIEVCSICDCPLFAKTKSPTSECPLGKWS